jgi:putative MATE family efflux protein
MSLVRTVWLLAWPILLARLVQAAANAVDIAMVGSLGAAATAAVGMGRQITLLWELGMLGIPVGAMTLTANLVGQRSAQGVSLVARQALVLGGIASLLLGGIGALVSRRVLILLGADGQVLALGTAYTRVYFIGLFFMMTSYIPWTLLQGAGDTVPSLYLVILINVLHVVFDYLFIYGASILPPMGVTGAALGTVVSRMVGLLAGMGLLYSKRYKVSLLPNTSYRPDWHTMWRILRIGVPVSTQGLVTSVASLLFLRMLASTSTSTIGLATYSIGTRLQQVPMLAAAAFSIAALSLVGQSLGAGRVGDAYRSGWTAAGLGTVVLAIVGLVVFVWATPLISLFTNDPQVVSEGERYLKILALALPFVALVQVMSGALEGAGDTKPLLYYAIVTQLFISLPLAYLLVFCLRMGVSGVWYSIAVSTIIQGLLMVRRFRSGAWEQVWI